ncbi:MAG: hypothetical protein Kow0069_23590 [Promethearchaeota archaeon]
MSYIPKYILKRMVPADAVKAVEGGVEITFVNVISPLTVDEIPGDPLDYLEVKLDGDPIPREQLAKIEIRVPDQDLNLTMANMQDAVGKTLPVGGKLVIFFPTDQIKAGETHEVEVTIKSDNPINVKIERVVQ